MPSILIAHSYPLIRDGISLAVAVLAVTPTNVGSDRAEADKRVPVQDRADLLITGVDTFQCEQLREKVASYRSELPNAKLLLVGSGLPIYELRASVYVGADGYYNLHDPAEKLVAVARALLNGATDPAFDLISRPERLLAAQEYAVYKMLMAGKSVREIAEETDRSPKTVYTMKYRIQHKLGFSGSDLLQSKSPEWQVFLGNNAA